MDLTQCTVKKEYFPGAYEELHFKQAARLAVLEGESDRLSHLLEFISSPEEIRRNRQWLRLVRMHMSRSNVALKKQNILSKFVITRECQSSYGINHTTVWEEFIEPLTVHARHPFSLASCRHIDEVDKAFSKVENLVRAPIMDVDYIILQSNRNLYYHKEESSPGIWRQRESLEQGQRLSNKHFMIDVGSSTFDSSLFWFTCAYSQLGVSFDRVLAFEKSLLEPTDFWGRVPMKWQPYWSFFNIPVNASEFSAASTPSPLSFVEELAQPHDFVSMKLDIDFPVIEMKLAQQLVQDSRIASLVDEFFFEVHFRCEIMTKCGWRSDIQNVGDFVMERLHVMKLFQTLRRNGIRAHFWP